MSTVVSIWYHAGRGEFRMNCFCFRTLINSYFLIEYNFLILLQKNNYFKTFRSAQPWIVVNVEYSMLLHSWNVLPREKTIPSVVDIVESFRRRELWGIDTINIPKNRSKIFRGHTGINLFKLRRKSLTLFRNRKYVHSTYFQWPPMWTILSPHSRIISSRSSTYRMWKCSWWHAPLPSFWCSHLNFHHYIDWFLYIPDSTCHILLFLSVILVILLLSYFFPFFISTCWSLITILCKFIFF